MTCGIYCITNTVTGDLYVGRSKQIEVRWRQHVLDLNTGRCKAQSLLEDWIRYGASAFKFSLLQECSNRYERVALEVAWIIKLQPKYNTQWKSTKIQKFGGDWVDKIATQSGLTATDILAIAHKNTPDR